MFGFSSAWAWLGIVGIALAVAIVIRLTPTVRLKRRLKRVHGRIVSTSRRPTVKFSVNVPKDPPDKRNKN
ncbi:MAG TPA: hypothetical protein GYA07_03295 [Verrucomicrobia bacterium]|nr:hypothetical protein [Verrucomicrobiota bacterium]HOP96691.1 hypothetical protein [Verrucomicrobiota bacterium]